MPFTDWCQAPVPSVGAEEVVATFHVSASLLAACQHMGVIQPALLRVPTSFQPQDPGPGSDHRLDSG